MSANARMLAGASALAGSSFLKGNSVFCQPPPDGKFPDSVKVLETRDMRYCSCPFWPFFGNKQYHIKEDGIEKRVVFCSVVDEESGNELIFCS